MYCDYCGKRIFEGDTYYEINDKAVCIDDVLDYLDENCREFGDDGEEIYVVDKMGYDVDDVTSILKSCERELEYDDEEPPEDPRDEPEFWRDR